MPFFEVFDQVTVHCPARSSAPALAKPGPAKQAANRITEATAGFSIVTPLIRCATISCAPNNPTISTISSLLRKLEKEFALRPRYSVVTKNARDNRRSVARQSGRCEAYNENRACLDDVEARFSTG